MRTSSNNSRTASSLNTSKTEISGSNHCSKRGKVIVIGLGPGDKEYMSIRALAALQEAEVVIGYKTYLQLIEHLIHEKQVLIASPMTKEVERSKQTIQLALEGKEVAVISSGDPGVYGMAGIILEVLYDLAAQDQVDIEIIPGITAANAAAASLGAPLMHDYVVLSLSDLLTPWEVIQKRIECAAIGDFVVAIYNPKSKKRVEQIKVLQEIMLKYKSSETPVGIVHNAKRGASEVLVVSTLGKFTTEYIDMFSVIIIGNSQTFIKDGKIITPRGYRL